MKSKDIQIGSIFDLAPGSFHATNELEPGSVPLISCGEEDNGLIGYFDIPSNKTHNRALTVSFNGFPLTTNFHPYRFGAKDDVAVLIPREQLSDGLLIYIAASLNNMKWRYSYGRKCYREKLKNVSVRLPMKDGQVDSSVPDALFRKAYENIKRVAERSVETLIRS
jgi:type I restriction enzyme M protein